LPNQEKLMRSKQLGECGQEDCRVFAMKSMKDYPPGLIGVVSALFGRTISASHRVDWTLDAMIAEQQCEFFRRFDPERDCVWIAMSGGVPRGALTIDGPRPETGRQSARLRFFILDESLRGRGLGRVMVAAALQFCRDKHYPRIFLTTLPGLDAAMHLYAEHGFQQIAESDMGFHGSAFVEQTLECRLD
jgi:GNAT superfamily N-acetyltransferase